MAGLTALNRRLTVTRLAWMLAPAPMAAFGLILWQTVVLGSGAALVWRFDWIPSLGLSLGLYFDHLSALFALLITGIGTLVVVYAGYYFKSDERPWGEWRFLTYLLLFMTAMLGLVLAGDVITLFVFWEGTSITSFLLIAYKTQDEAARRGAFKSLFITGGGGIALLVGLLLLSYVAGGSDWATILSSGDLLRQSALYPALLGLIALGAFTKSAQTPFHIWLPDAMSAPTPASAYLHSATMVKAGIYLLARLNPALGLHRPVVLAIESLWLGHHADRRVPGPEAAGPEGAPGLLDHQPARRVGGAHRPGYRDRLQGAGHRCVGTRPLQERPIPGCGQRGSRGRQP